MNQNQAKQKNSAAMNSETSSKVAAARKLGRPPKRRKKPETSKIEEPKSGKQSKKIKLDKQIQNKPEQNEPRVCDAEWEPLLKDSSISGIEFRDCETSELVRFIAIRHPEILDSGQVFRITIEVSKDGTFDMPPKQTFEEMIQAKRRFQQLLYGPNTSANSSILSERAARRVAAAARRQNLSSSRRRHTGVQLQESHSVGEPSGQEVAGVASENTVPRHPLPARPRPSGGRNSTSSKRSSTARRRPPSNSRRSSAARPSKKAPAAQLTVPGSAESKPKRPPAKPKTTETVAATTAATAVATNESDTSATNTSNHPSQLIESPLKSSAASSSNLSFDCELPSTSTGITDGVRVLDPAQPIGLKTPDDPNPIRGVVSSLKELKNNTMMLSAEETKEIKKLLKTALPGTIMLLSNGTVVRKSRRGGARAGAGRKRSRPLPAGWMENNQQSNSTSTPSQSHQGSPNKSELSYDGSVSNQSSIRPTTSLATD